MSRRGVLLTSVFAHCKFEDCRGRLDAGCVTTIQEIPEAPNHVAAIAVCTLCGRKGQYVMRRDMWEAASDEHARGTVALNEVESLMIAAAAQVAAVDTVSELVAFWASLSSPPIIEEHIGKCNCPDCRRRLYFE